MSGLRSLALLSVATAALLAASAEIRLAVEPQYLPNPDNEPAPVHPLPHPRQISWNETEFYAFFHYGMNTYTGLEWGYGDEDETLFAPVAKPDPRQWLEAVKAAGMKGGIAVAKHHDGFCLWPTATTTHSVVLGGNEYARDTNIPRDFAEAARDLGMKYGFYVSPWDRNSACYGDGTDRYVNEVFLRQCAELAQYGTDQFEMWLDGANGGTGYYGGACEERAIDASIYYDVPNLRDSVHSVCPDCVMWGVGEEARWIGNESGYAGETCWSMGSGENGCADGWKWAPGESDAKATDLGWFWHPGEEVLSARRMLQMYLETVGRNATLILNCPPDRSGVLPDATVSRLKEAGDLLRKCFGDDLARKAHISATETRQRGAMRTYDAVNMTDGDKDTYWATDDGVTSATITLTWDEAQTVRYVALMEYIRLGQRVKRFRIEVPDGQGGWESCADNIEQTTIGYKRIIPLNGSTSDSYDDGREVTALRIIIEDAKACPLIHTLSVY